MSPPISWSTVDESSCGEWDDFAQGPHGRFTQATWWAEPMRSLGMEFDVIGCREDGELTGGALIRWAQPRPLPFSRGTCLGGPVFSRWSRSMAGPFLDAVQAAARRRHAVEVVFIDVPDRTIADDLVAELGRRRARFHTRPNSSHAVIDLKGRTTEDVVKDMRDRAKYSIKRGRRTLRFEPLTDDASLATAYDAFEATAARKDFELRPKSAGLPTLREAVDRDAGVVIGAIHEEQVVAAAFVSFMGDEAVYEYGGFLDSAGSLYPNHALQAEAIDLALERGFDAYNLGVLSLKQEDAGVNDFKTGFGAVPRERTPRIQWATMPIAGRVMDRLTTSRHGQNAIKMVRRSVASRARSA